MKTVVIWNAKAGKKARNDGQAGMSTERMTELLGAVGITADVWPTEGGSQTRELAQRALAEGYETVVAAGGDGTISNVALALLNSPVALGILPLGSVMNIPRSLGMARELDAALQLLARRPTRWIDVGLANGAPFFEAASVGLSAAMFRAAEEAEVGDYSSVARSLWIALRYRPARVALRLDGRLVRARALMVTVSNGPYTGLGMTVAPAARLDDQLFDVRVFSHYSALDLMRHLGSIAFGRRAFTPHVRTERAAKVIIDASRRLGCRADGRDIGVTPLECSVLPAALQVIADPMS
jgi:diacylglycerol kinase (ATP)